MNDYDCLRVILIDDEAASISMLMTLLERMDGVVVEGSTTNPLEAIPLYLSLKPDLIFMDIQMGSTTGFEVLRDFHKIGLTPLVVFTTAYNTYGIEAVKNHAFDYLLKPVDAAELTDVVTNARQHLKQRDLEKRLENLERVVKNHAKLRFNTRSGFVLIHPDEIFYIEAAANYSEIHQSKDKREVVSMNIGTIEKMLPEHFIRISRSHIINSMYLTRVSGSARKCTLRRNNLEVQFTIPERQLPELKKKLEK